ncbi:MAG: amidophosphoribosyltransferase, partial [Actinobacteria bacterium]|nr:amidophosphoribosyltransferase [Actinomycetota bacterium]
LGHVRYSTTGSTQWENSQPLYQITDAGPIAIAHNGNLVNTLDLREVLESEGSGFATTSDTEVMAALLAVSSKDSVPAAIEEMFPRLKGAYSVCILTEDGIIAVRDPNGVRPLCIGKRNNGAVIASETAALDVIGAEFVREVSPGEIVKIGKGGIESKQFIPPAKESLCIFEFIYFARPDSMMYDQLIYDVRKRMGMRLFEEAPVDADLVIPVPDSGIPAAVGYAQQSGIPYGEGLIKNRYIGRTFIEPTQSIRQLGVRIKLNPLKPIISGKRLVVVDDSIVRGNTSRKIVEILKEAGAKEVHMMVSSPPIRYPCFYGIDTAVRSELIASHKSIEEIRDFLGADSLNYLSIENLVDSCGAPKDKFCTACFEGNYPIEVPKDMKMSKFRFEEKSAT